MKELRRVVLAARLAVGLLASASAGADASDGLGSFASYSLTGKYADIVSQVGGNWLYASGATAFYPYNDDPLYDGGSGTASVAARGAIGWAQAGAAAGGTGYSVFSNSGWGDLISVNVPGLAGQHGTFTFSVAYDWVAPTSSAYAPSDWDDRAASAVTASLLTAASPDSGGQFQWAQQIANSNCVSVNSCSHELYWEAAGDVVGTPGSGPAPTVSGNLVTFSFDVVFGEQYQMWVGTSAFVVGRNGSGAVDASNNIAWAGLYSVRDANGQLLDPNAVGMSSALGFDFNQAVSAVSEPASCLLMVAGLAAITGLRRYRREVA